jgi:hypothetical protein
LFKRFKRFQTFQRFNPALQGEEIVGGTKGSGDEICHKKHKKAQKKIL